MSKALTYAVFGARGTGKGAFTRQLIDRHMRPSRLMVFDFKNDPGPSMAGVGVPVHSLGDLARAAAAKSFRLRYLVRHDGPLSPVDQFEGFCEIAWRAGNLVMWVDELPEVTKSNKAPPTWRRCVNVGRDYTYQGARKWLAIVGSGQRLNETDKSFIANADVIHTGRLGYAAEARELAAGWGIDHREILDLPDLHWIEKRADKPGVVRGVLTFGNARPVEVKKKLPLKTAGARTP